ncbi:hypothetical protein [Nonomuraea cavernae]|uniref:hypothetical protein n=1 Tax=Nonomuraea cavernae TaxID=2045107 RepID=UPI00340B5718
MALIVARTDIGFLGECWLKEQNSRGTGSLHGRSWRADELTDEATTTDRAALRDGDARASVMPPGW